MAERMIPRAEELRYEVAARTGEAQIEYHEKRIKRLEDNIAALDKTLIERVNKLDHDVTEELAAIRTAHNYIIPTLQTLVTQTEFTPIKLLVYCMAGSGLGGLIIFFFAKAAFK